MLLVDGTDSADIAGHIVHKLLISASHERDVLSQRTLVLLTADLQFLECMGHPCVHCIDLFGGLRRPEWHMIDAAHSNQNAWTTASTLTCKFSSASVFGTRAVVNPHNLKFGVHEMVNHGPRADRVQQYLQLQSETAAVADQIRAFGRPALGSLAALAARSFSLWTILVCPMLLQNEKIICVFDASEHAQVFLS
jgi:hypothetical protein